MIHLLDEATTSHGLYNMSNNNHRRRLSISIDRYTDLSSKITHHFNGVIKIAFKTY